MSDRETRVRGLRRIDSHQHVFWWHRDDAGLVADLDEQGIDVAWLLSWLILPSEDAAEYHPVLNPLHARPDGTHAGIPLSDLVLAKSRYPDRFVLGYCPHPGLGDAPQLFEAACRMHGVRVCGEWKFRMLFDDPRCLELFRKAGELGCPVVLHLDVPFLPDRQTGRATYQPKWYGGTVANLERALQACPGTNFIGHAPGFWREISGDADSSPELYPGGAVTPGGRLYRLLRTHANLYADLSAGSARLALDRDHPHAREFLCTFADRLLFARDYYGGDLAELLARLELPGEVMRKLECENALRLVPLGS
jgi:predicted TIM-barrel fold metal-dependent hydrolase